MAAYYLSRFGDTTKVLLSNAGRAPVKASRRKVGEQQRLASGAMVRDITAIKRSYTFAWERLPHRDEDVLDGGAGFLTLLSLYDEDEDEGKLTLEVPKGDGTVETVHGYLRASVPASLALRVAGQPGVMYWNVTIEFVED